MSFPSPSFIIMLRVHLASSERTGRLGYQVGGRRGRKSVYEEGEEREKKEKKQPSIKGGGRNRVYSILVIFCIVVLFY